MSWTEEKIKETITSVQEKAQNDSAFREALLANPRTSIEEFSGLELPNSFSLNIVDANSADMTFLLAKTQTSELSDSDLESVAGGKVDLTKDNSADSEPDEQGMLSGNDY